jgi:hypothetical protein
MGQFNGVSHPRAALTISDAASAEIDNPEYTSWSRFELGTSLTVKMVTAFNGMSHESMQIVKLLEVGSDNLVLETDMTMTIAGRKTHATIKRDVPKSQALPSTENKADAAKPTVKLEEGFETLTIGGAEYKCTWKHTKVSGNGNDIELKTWHCDEVPGVMVKMESTTGPSANIKTRVDVIEFRKG